MSARQTRSPTSRVRASRTERAASPSAPLYVVADEAYYLWSVSRQRIVLRSLNCPTAFLDTDVSGALDASCWVYG